MRVRDAGGLGHHVRDVERLTSDKRRLDSLEDHAPPLLGRVTLPRETCRTRRIASARQIHLHTVLLVVEVVCVASRGVRGGILAHPPRPRIVKGCVDVEGPRTTCLLIAVRNGRRRRIRNVTRLRRNSNRLRRSGGTRQPRHRSVREDAVVRLRSRLTEWRTIPRIGQGRCPHYRAGPRRTSRVRNRRDCERCVRLTGHGSTRRNCRWIIRT